MDNLWITLGIRRQYLLLSQVKYGFKLWTTGVLIEDNPSTLQVCIRLPWGLGTL